MDLKSMFQKNVDTMKSKLPAMPTLPKLTKFKSRKIFSLSRSKDNISSSDGNFSSSNQLSSVRPQMQLTVPSAIINSSPHRISTISSLVEGSSEQINYNHPDTSNESHTNRRIRFEDDNIDSKDYNKKPPTTTHRFTERLTRQYKELSEFKFSHIFGKKTIVRKTEIQVDMYKQSYQEELVAKSPDSVGGRRKSNDYEFEFKSIPNENVSSDDAGAGRIGGSKNNPNLSSTPSGIESTTEIHAENLDNFSSLNEIQMANPSSPAPLSRRKVFIPTSDEMADYKEKIPIKKTNFKLSQKRKSKKKGIDVKDTDSCKGSIRSKGSQKSKGMWQVRRATRIPAVQVTENKETATGSENFKKSLSNVFKKFSSTTSIDEQNTEENQRSSKMDDDQCGVKWPIRRVKSTKKNNDNSIDDPSLSSEDSELKKQFNKMFDKSKQIKKLMNKDSIPTTAGNFTASTTSIEDPAKMKSMEEIETLGYGRKNLKYIEMWKVRRRREIRRNEPLAINRSDSQKDQPIKTKGMWKVRRPTIVRINADNKQHMADVTRSLMNLLKRDEIKTDSQSAGISETQSSSASRRWKFRKEISTESLDNNEIKPQNGTENDDKPGFWKKMSIKTKTSNKNDNNSKDDIENPTNESSNVSQMFGKAKKRMSSQMERLNFIKSKSIDSNNSQDETYTNNPETIIKKSGQINSQQNDSDDDYLNKSDDEDSMIYSHPWRSQKPSTAYSSSDEEETITTPGYLRNQCLSAQFGDFESTTIIVRKPIPTILQHEPLPPRHSNHNPTATPPPINSSSTFLLPTHLELPIPVVMPTPPPPKRQVPVAAPLSSSFRQTSFSPNTMLPPKSPTKSLISKSPSPPSLPNSPPPEFSPSKSLSPSLSEMLIEQQQLLSSPPTPIQNLAPFIHLPIIHEPPILYQHFDIKSPIELMSQPKHSRKTSIDSNDSDSWIPESFVNHNPLGLNKIDETYESWSSITSNDLTTDTLKKWQSIDIFNGNESPEAVFQDFEDELKNEPVVAIIKNIDSNNILVESIVVPKPIIVTESNVVKTIAEPITIPSEPTISQPLKKFEENSDDDDDEHGPATGVPITTDKHNITKPLVKQASMRRQFSEEKDAEDLNKKRNVNKMISRFDPERFSSRRSIKHEKIQVIAIIEPQTVRNKELLGNINQPSSLDVELDLDDSQSVYGFTTEDESDNSDVTVHKPIIKISEKRHAPPPPPLPTTAAPPPPTQIPILIKNNNKIIEKSLKNEKIVGQQKQNVINKNVFDAKMQSEDKFYSFDATEEDDALQGYSLPGGRKIIREIYTIDL